MQIALAHGDGIGPEITSACITVFEAAGVMDRIEFVPVEMGRRVFDSGETRGMTDSAIDTIERLGLLFKGPMGTPSGGGGKSINVTLRKALGAFANLRHFQSLPGVETVYSRAGVPVDFYVVRENVEDTYGGVEYRLSNDVVECKRLISAPGCDQLHHYAFKTAKAFGIDKITCGHKANIMKMTDGLFLDRFHNAARDYPEIETEDVIIDALCMNLVLRPQQYKMIALTNLQGDIVSDLAAGLVGGLGFAPSANIGEKISIFEAVHGTAPDIAGQNKANPTSLLLSGLIMLRHIGMKKQAAIIENALLYTLESGVHTGDVRGAHDPVGTREFAASIAKNLGKVPSDRYVRDVPVEDAPSFEPPERPRVNRLMQTYRTTESAVLGCDLYIETLLAPHDLAQKLELICASSPFRLTMMSSRGTQVWPTGSVYTEVVDYYRARFELRDKHMVGRIGQTPTIHLFEKVAETFAVTNFQLLKEYDGKRGFSLAQGQ
ncbi:MAG TPA: isocitrate dehydrogenase [Phycisphaerales bacterium]|nr:isocitrate dehydrogenase [Phycisphaerales bacterium]